MYNFSAILIHYDFIFLNRIRRRQNVLHSVSCKRLLSVMPLVEDTLRWAREYLRGKYHCTIDLLFDWFILVCFANKDKNCQLLYSRFQTSQTGGLWYSDASPFSIPWMGLIKFCRSIVYWLEVIVTKTWQNNQRGKRHWQTHQASPGANPINLFTAVIY